MWDDAVRRKVVSRRIDITNDVIISLTGVDGLHQFDWTNRGIGILMRVPSQVDVDRIVRIDLVELLDNINRHALGFTILGLYPSMCQDNDRIDALIAQNLFIMSNGFGFIKNLIILVVVIECQNRQIGRLDADKADFYNLVCELLVRNI